LFLIRSLQRIQEPHLLQWVRWCGLAQLFVKGQKAQRNDGIVNGYAGSGAAERLEIRGVYQQAVGSSVPLPVGWPFLRTTGAVGCQQTSQEQNPLH
jgi:hypothetical protein